MSAPVVTVPGVLVEVLGEVVLLTGASGVGKSELALELVSRGARLIVDDAGLRERLRATDRCQALFELITRAKDGD